MKNWLIILLVCSFAGQALAQEAPAPATTLPATPTKESAPAPAAVPTLQPAPSGIQPVPAAVVPATPALIPPKEEGYFPQLPPSRQCAARDLFGVWKLIKVYENPLGTAMQAFNAEPYQYIIFHRTNTVFKEIKSSLQPLSNTDLQNKVAASPRTAWQYVLNEGFLYFYKEGIAQPNTTMACFIVSNARDVFAGGQLLLMPPAPAQGAPAVRMVRVYQKIDLNAKSSTRKSRRNR